MKLTTYKECEDFIRDNTPFAIKNSNDKLVFPFISSSAQELVIKTLAKSLYEKYKLDNILNDNREIGKYSNQ